MWVNVTSSLSSASNLLVSLVAMLVLKVFYVRFLALYVSPVTI